MSAEKMTLRDQLWTTLYPRFFLNKKALAEALDAIMPLLASLQAPCLGKQGEWTAALETARLDLCHFLVEHANDPHTLTVHVDLGRRMLEAEQALTVMADMLCDPRQWGSGEAVMRIRSAVEERVAGARRNAERSGIGKKEIEAEFADEMETATVPYVLCRDLLALLSAQPVPPEDRCPCWNCGGVGGSGPPRGANHCDVCDADWLPSPPDSQTSGGG